MKDRDGPNTRLFCHACNSWQHLETTHGGFGPCTYYTKSDFCPACGRCMFEALIFNARKLNSNPKRCAAKKKELARNWSVFHRKLDPVETLPEVAHAPELVAVERPDNRRNAYVIRHMLQRLTERTA